jgi:hypothetical protein
MKKRLFYLWLGMLILSILISLTPKGLDADLFGVFPTIFIVCILIPFISGILLILIQKKDKSYQFIPGFLVGSISINLTSLLVISLMEFFHHGCFTTGQLYKPDCDPLGLFHLFSFFMAICILGGLVGLVIRGITMLIKK